MFRLENSVFMNIIMNSIMNIRTKIDPTGSNFDRRVI